MVLRLDHELIARFSDSPEEKKERINTAEPVYTDHMICMAYREDSGWQTFRIHPRSRICIDAQSGTFRQKRYCTAEVIVGKSEEGILQIFRAEETAASLSARCRQKGIPAPDEELMTDCIRTLAEAEKDWITVSEDVLLHIWILILSETAFSQEFQLNITAEVLPVQRDQIRLISCRSLLYDSSGIHMQHERDGKNEVQMALSVNDQGEIVGCPEANVFFRTGRRVCTPPSPLGGIAYSDLMKDSAIRLMEAEGLSVEECSINVTWFDCDSAGRIGNIDEIFITSLAEGIRPVTEWSHFGRILWKNGGIESDTLAKNLQARMRRILTGKEDIYRWILYGNKRHG
mgnify:CR=1 FL=1